MCNLYSLNKNKESVATMFRVPHNRMPQLPFFPAVFPGYNAPVVRPTSDGDREVVLMSWGFVLLQSDKDPRRVTNVLDDKILDSKFWRPSFEERRCLVPATSFSEPHGSKPKPVPSCWFALKGDEPRPLFAFPGVWRRWKGPVKKDGPTVDLDVYSILTAEPNALVATVNHERSPVLLTRDEEFEAWLNAPPEAAMALAKPFDPDAMRIVKEGFEMEDVVA
jgi:putative SOS response-associated peptidase YedK